MEAECLREIPAWVGRHASWRPWFVMYAEYAGHRLALADTATTSHNFDPHDRGYSGRYIVATGPATCVEPAACSAPSGDGHACAYYCGDDLEEARDWFLRLESALVSGFVVDSELEKHTGKRMGA